MDAAVTFIVLGDLRDPWVTMAAEGYADPQKARDEAIRSASSAAMALMIAAQAKGYVSGPRSGFDPEGVRRLRHSRPVPAGEAAHGGYAASGTWLRKVRLDVDEALAFDRGKEF